MKLLRLLVLIPLLMTGLMQCSMDSPSKVTGGGGIETVALSGIMLDENGNYASGVLVTLVPDDYNPKYGFRTDFMKDTTNEKGEYSFAVSINDAYNIEAVHIKKRTRMLISDVVLCCDSTIPPYALKEPGLIQIELPTSCDLESGYVFVEGTQMSCNLFNNVIEKKYLIIDSVPATCISNLYYDELNTSDLPILLIDTITVIPNDTAGILEFVRIDLYNRSTSELPGNAVRTIRSDNNGILWMGTKTGGLVKLDGDKWTIYNTSNSDIPNNCVYEIELGKEGCLWIGTRNGLSSFNDGLWTVYNTQNSNLLNDSVYVLFVDSDNSLWIGTDCGLNKLSDGVMRQYTTHNSDLPGNRVFSIAEDNNGALWVGTYKGLSKKTDTKWITYDKSNSAIPGNLIHSIVFEQNGDMWIGTHNNGVAKFNPTGWISYGSGYLGDSRVKTIAIDSKGTKWFGTSGTGFLVSYNDETWVRYNNEDLNMKWAFESLNDVTIDKFGRIYMATELDGVLVLGYKYRLLSF